MGVKQREKGKRRRNPSTKKSKKWFIKVKEGRILNFFLGYRMRINLFSGLVKPGDQALILIAVILKFSAKDTL